MFIVGMKYEQWTYKFLMYWDDHFKSYVFETSFKMKLIFYSVYRYIIISTETKIIQKRMANLIGKSTKIKTVKHKTHTKTKPNKQIKHKQKKNKWALINTQKPWFLSPLHIRIYQLFNTAKQSFNGDILREKNTRYLIWKNICLTQIWFGACNWLLLKIENSCCVCWEFVTLNA